MTTVMPSGSVGGMQYSSYGGTLEPHTHNFVKNKDKQKVPLTLN